MYHTAVYKSLNLEKIFDQSQVRKKIVFQIELLSQNNISLFKVKDKRFLSVIHSDFRIMTSQQIMKNPTTCSIFFLKKPLFSLVLFTLEHCWLAWVQSKTNQQISRRSRSPAVVMEAPLGLKMCSHIFLVWHIFFCHYTYLFLVRYFFCQHIHSFHHQKHVTSSRDGGSVGAEKFY